MEIITYRNPNHVDFSGIQQTLNDPGHQLEKELAGKLGFKEQVALYENEFLDSRCPYRKLSNREKFIWGEFLPKQYQKQEFANYKFDRIPLDVLEEYEFALGLNIFKDFLIRTNENVGDPILIGVIGTEEYLIARWGEALQPYEQIEAQFINRNRRVQVMWVGAQLLFSLTLYAIWGSIVIPLSVLILLFSTMVAATFYVYIPEDE